jgi:GTP-sensing pleiotropic transcriptional regulator CodY
MDSNSQQMPRERDSETGKWSKTYTVENVIGALEDLGGSASTAEVTDALGCSRRLALMRLRELESDERVSARKVGNSFLWTYTGDSDD